jgi:hypothetical protein
MLLACLGLGAVRPADAAEFGPQSIVRQFCRADGLGKRVNVAGWDEFAPLVAWSYEPAWDHVMLITGYEVGSPRVVAPNVIGVDVNYAVIGQVSALGFDAAVHLETVTFRLDGRTAPWRIIGPPPAPHIFNSRADVESMRRSLEVGGLNFVPNTLFIWHMFRSAGWNVPLVATPDLQSGGVYRSVKQPKAGDVVVYLRDGVPYHAALLEADGQVVSSTLNFGVVRTATEAFAGEVKYLRLVQPEPEAEPPLLPTPALTTPASGPSPARTPAPAIKQGKRRSTKSPSRARRKRVQAKRSGSRARHPTPTPVPRRNPS